MKPNGTPTAHSFKTRLAALRRRKRFIPCRDTRAYAGELLDLLALLDAVTDPREGVTLVAAFYRADDALFSVCDDSNGAIGDVFRCDARDRFAMFAAQCDDQPWLAALVLDLLATDDYGVRDAVMDVASQYLSPGQLRTLADAMWHATASADAPSDESDAKWIGQRWFGLIELLAAQLNDAALFERARRASSPELGVAACTHIARAWFAAGDPAAALAWLARVTPDERFMAEERDQLLRAIYHQTGDRDRLEALVWRRFRATPVRNALDALLEVIGTDRRDDVIAEATAAIAATQRFDSAAAAFLLDCGRIDDAARYVITRQSSVDGGDWPALLPLAESFLTAGERLAATVVYRALLDAILARGYQPAYRHGARHLHTLDLLAQCVTDWAGVTPHHQYFVAVRANHGKKTSFWRRYEEEG